MLGLALELLNATPAEDGETRFRHAAALHALLLLAAWSAWACRVLAWCLRRSCSPCCLRGSSPKASAAHRQRLQSLHALPACVLPRRAVVAVGTLARDSGKVRGMCRDLGLLSLMQQLKGSGGRAGEAAAEAERVLRL